MTGTKQYLKIVTLLIITTAAVVIFWGVQKISSYFKQLASESASIRVTESNSCITTGSNLESPHFSGCNSLL